MLSFAYTKSRFTLFRLSYAPSDKRASVSSADALLFCLFSKKTPKTLTRPWAGVHNYSYTVPVSPLPAPGRSAPGVFCGADSGRTAAPAFIFPCRRTALQSRSLAAKTEGCGVFGFFRPSGNRQNRIRHPASSHPPFFGSSAAPPACFCNMRPVFLQNRTDNF